jgi:hypothetical protein
MGRHVPFYFIIIIIIIIIVIIISYLGEQVLV